MTLTQEFIAATWERLHRLGDRVEDRRIGHIPPVTVLAAADALLGEAEVRYADAKITVTERTEWRLVVITDTEIIDVVASADDGLWIFDHPGPSVEQRLNPKVTARSWALDRVRAVVLDMPPREWLPGNHGVPTPSIRIEIDGAEDVPVPLDPTRRVDSIAAVRAVIDLIREARQRRGPKT